jgi:Fe-S-cluster containining protein
MLDDYFQHQADLSDLECNLRCPNNCSAPGCWMADVIVEVTLFDLIKLSQILNIPVSRLFSQHCRLGLMNCEFDLRYKKFLIKLKKPCFFLMEKRCRVHGSKPLSCVLFPEYQQIKGLIPELTRNPIFSGFPCLENPIVVSDKRNRALKNLRRMSLMEQALSSYVLFGVPSFIVDSKPLKKRLKRDHPKGRAFSIQDYDRLLYEMLKSNGFFEKVMGKISALDQRTRMKNIFEKLNDRITMRYLMKDLVRPKVVHRLENEHIKRFKRNLHPPAIHFM